MLALAAGAFEAGIAVSQSLAAGEPLASLVAPLGIRLLAFTVLAALALAMRSGRGWSRWLLLVLFGGLGTWSLVADPISFMLAGVTIADVVASAGPWDIAFIVSRVIHIAAVWTAAVLMFTAPRYFARR